jgi:hypothetical protein
MLNGVSARGAGSPWAIVAMPLLPQPGCCFLRSLKQNGDEPVNPNTGEQARYTATRLL